MGVSLIAKGYEAVGIASIVNISGRPELAQKICENWQYKGDKFLEAVMLLIDAIHSNKFETTLEPALLNLKHIASELEEVEARIKEINHG